MRGQGLVPSAEQGVRTLGEGATDPAPGVERLAPPSGSSRGGTPRLVPRWGLFLLVILFAIPAIPASAGAAVPASTGTHLSSSSSSPAQTPPTTSLLAGLPGSNPALGIPIDRSSLPHARAPFASVLPAPASSPVKVSPAAATPAATIYGTIYGTIIDSVTLQPISGVEVDYSPLGSACPKTTCGQATTGSTGRFQLRSPTGYGVVTFTAPYYMDNRSFVNLTALRPVNLGIVFMEHDGYVSGRLVTADPSHSPVSGVNVSASSASFSELAYPYSLTDGNGNFVYAPVLPVPSVVSFIPVQTYTRFVGNSTWITVHPYQNVNLGTIYIEAGVVVRAELLDSLQSHAAGRPIPADYGTFAAGQASSTLFGQLFQQGQASPQSASGTTVYFFASPGPNNIIFFADGYLSNFTQLTIPSNVPYSQVYDLGNVYMVEEGVYTIKVGLTWGWNASAAESAWGTGLVRFSACSLDNLWSSLVVMTPRGINMTDNICVGGGCNGGVGATQAAIAAPLRNRIEIDADITAGCAMTPTWPVPSGVPVINDGSISNITYANITSSLAVATNLGEHDIQPGTYVFGQVLGDRNFTVQACSTDEANICGSVTYATDTPSTNGYNYDPAGCPVGPTFFCVPMPFGPSKITVTSPGASYSNFTTAYIKPANFNGGNYLNLTKVTPTHIWTIKIGYGDVTGIVHDARTNKPIQNELVTITTKPADPNAPFLTANGVVTGSNGAFTVRAPPGEDLISASAPLYATNSTWANVPSVGTYVGIINLTPLGFIEGRVIFANGTGVPLGQVQYCNINSPQTCQSLGLDGLTSTNGSYFGQVKAGRIPLGTYRVVATADGTTTNWTWVNVTTPGGTVFANPIVLWPAGPSGAAPRSAPARPASASAHLVWLSGRLIDGATRKGLFSGAWSITATSSTGNTVSFTQLNSGGFYNASIAPGNWWFNASGQGVYYDGSVFLNVSSNAISVTVPTLTLHPFPWIRGRVVIDPWESIGTIAGLGVSGTVHVCTKISQPCGLSMKTDSSGAFNTTAPPGVYDFVTYAGLGTGIGTVNGGFDPDSSSVNITNKSRPFLNEKLTIYSYLAGAVFDQSTQNTSPVRWAQMSVFSVPTDPNSPVTNYGEMLNGGGEYTVLLPYSNNASVQANGGAGAFTSAWAYGTKVPKGSGGVSAPISLRHFGWIVFRVKDPSGLGFGGGGGYGWIGGAGIAVSQNSTSYTSSGTANEFGLVNITAPPGPNLTVSVNSPEYSSATFYTHANQSATTFCNLTVPVKRAYTNLGNISLLGWPWLTGRVMDPVRNNLSLAGVTISITNAQGNSNPSPPPTSNGAGVWVSDAPLGAVLTVDMTLMGYELNSTPVSVPAGQFTDVGVANLTGYGVVAGHVISYPGNKSISGAMISVCRKDGSLCVASLAETNGSGIFWAIAPPGLDVINVSALNYVTNSSVLVAVQPDSWNWVGSIVATSYAFVFGYVRGLPSGALLDGANVSACFPNIFPGGSPIGGCVVGVQTNVTGQFYLPVPANTYLLDANATLYNDTFLPISLSPGESISVGTMLIQEYGFISGSVIGGDTRAAVVNASVEVCSQWTPITCAGPTITNKAGRFYLDGPPGQYLLTAVAPGYQQTSGLSVTFESGTTVILPPIVLTPMGSGQTYVVSGVVRLAGPNLTVAGAIVSAGPTFATAANTAGQFALTLPYGSYTLTASLPGYLTASLPVTVHSSVSGLVLWLTVFDYPLTGIVSDGLTGAPLDNVSISENGITIAASDSAGQYSVPLANGTHTLFAIPTGLLATEYVQLEFRVQVLGGPANFDVHMFPHSQRVSVLVVDAVSGLPIANATVTGVGHTVEHVPVSFALQTSGLGTVAVILYNGSYVINATAAGYQTASGIVTEDSVLLTLPLRPMSPAGVTPTNAFGGQLTEYALVGGAVAAVAAGALLLRRLSATPRVLRSGGRGTGTGD